MKSLSENLTNFSLAENRSDCCKRVLYLTDLANSLNGNGTFKVLAKYFT